MSGSQTARLCQISELRVALNSLRRTTILWKPGPFEWVIAVMSPMKNCFRGYQVGNVTGRTKHKTQNERPNGARAWVSGSTIWLGQRLEFSGESGLARRRFSGDSQIRLDDFRRHAHYLDGSEKRLWRSGDTLSEREQCKLVLRLDIRVTIFVNSRHMIDTLMNKKLNKLQENQLNSFRKSDAQSQKMRKCDIRPAGRN
jgi:hypothetical protein